MSKPEAWRALETNVGYKAVVSLSVGTDPQLCRQYLRLLSMWSHPLKHPTVAHHECLVVWRELFILPTCAARHLAVYAKVAYGARR